jgi:hypothetical protein
VKNIIVLQKMTGSTIMVERAFLNQTAPLNKIKEVIEDEDEETKQVSNSIAPPIQPLNCL